MGRVARVIEFARRVVNGEHVAEAKVDPGGGSNLTADHFGPVGDDSKPLPGDYAATSDSAGSGRDHITGYSDPKNAGKAADGEVRRYARSSDGTPVCEFWLKGDGDIEITSLLPTGNVVINGVTIDSSGNISAPGDVTANEGANSVTLGTHIHSTAMGPSGSPTPGT